jgi:hypothetical protein
MTAMSSITLHSDDKAVSQELAGTGGKKPDLCLFHDVVQFLATTGFQIRAFSAKTNLGARLLQADVLFERVSQNGTG